ncbi:MAG: hypothetical protein LBV68_04160 [Spirochaetaceae bacterium]|jgi:hypothetical protein|nr:hypothetical protein [Spirochaetaceae bacterium]
MGSKGSGGGRTVYRDDPSARRYQQEAHDKEMKRLEESHQQQMKILQETVEKTAKALTEISNGRIVAEQRYDKNTATIQDTQDIHRKLEKKRKEFQPIAAKLEETLKETAESGFNLILTEVEQIKNDTGLSFDINAMKQKADNSIKKMEGSIGEIINRRVALSEPECADILEEESEEKREQGIQVFLNKVLKESFKNSKAGIEEAMKELIDMVSYTVTNRIGDKKQELQHAAEELTFMQNALSESEIKAKEKQYQGELDSLDGFLSSLGKGVEATAR